MKFQEALEYAEKGQTIYTHVRNKKGTIKRGILVDLDQKDFFPLFIDIIDFHDEWKVMPLSNIKDLSHNVVSV